MWKTIQLVKKIRHGRWSFWPHFGILRLLTRTSRLFYSSSVPPQLKKPLTNAVQLLRDWKPPTWGDVLVSRAAVLDWQVVVLFAARHWMLVMRRLTFSQVLAQNTWLEFWFLSLPLISEWRISRYSSAPANVLIGFSNAKSVSLCLMCFKPQTLRVLQ